MSDIYKAMAEWWHTPIVEVRQPRPGVRHQAKEKEVWHRFPVKGGITPREAMMRLRNDNALFRMIKVADG